MLNKNNTISGITVINGCQPFVTEDGYVIPLLLFEPIYINGRVFKNQVIYTWDEFDKLSPKLNDKFAVVPGKDRKYTLFNLDSRTTDETHVPIPKPTLCPDCNSELKTVGCNLYCMNYECPTADIRRVLRYLNFCCVYLDIVYRDLITVYRHGYIKDIMDLYSRHPSSVKRNLPFIKEKVTEVTTAANLILKVDVQNIYFSLLPGISPMDALKISQLRDENEKWFDPISREKFKDHMELEDYIMKLNKELIRNRVYYRLLNEIVSVENTSRTPQFNGKTFIVGKTISFSSDYYCIIIALNGGVCKKDYLTLPLENADFILGDIENEEERISKKVKNNKSIPKKITEEMFCGIVPMLYASSRYKLELANGRRKYLALVGSNE